MSDETNDIRNLTLIKNFEIRLAVAENRIHKLEGSMDTVIDKLEKLRELVTTNNRESQKQMMELMKMIGDSVSTSKSTKNYVLGISTAATLIIAILALL